MDWLVGWLVGLCGRQGCVLLWSSLLWLWLSLWCDCVCVCFVADLLSACVCVCGLPPFPMSSSDLFLARFPGWEARSEGEQTDYRWLL